MSAKAKLNSIGVLISKTLIGPSISHDEFVSVNNELREYHQFIKDFIQFVKQCHLLVWSVEKHTESKIRRLQIQIKGNQCFYQIVPYVAVKNRDLSKNKSLADQFSLTGIKPSLSNNNPFANIFF